MQKKIPTHYLAHLSDRYLVELPGSGLSWRSVLLGLGLVVAISIGSPYSIWMVGSSEMTWSYFPTAVGAPLFLLVLGNALLKRALSATELITIIIMGLVASGMPIFIVGLILSIISKPYYGALPTNQWAEYVHPYLPSWAIPDPAHDAMRFFLKACRAKTGPFRGGYGSRRCCGGCCWCWPYTSSAYVRWWCCAGIGWSASG